MGDPVLLNRPIKRCHAAQNTFSGAYLDNGLGCFVAAEVARLVAERGLGKNTTGTQLNCQFAFSAHEEIGRFGSRICVAECRPDVLIAGEVLSAELSSCKLLLMPVLQQAHASITQCAPACCS